MALGAVGAYLVFFKKQRILNVIFKKTFIRLMILVFIAALILMHQSHTYQLFSLLFIIFILNVSVNPDNKLNLEHTAFKYLGKISYGIYMLHPIAITICIKTIYAVPFHDNLKIHQFMVYGFAVLLSVGLASLSYYFIEKSFLIYKKRFTPYNIPAEVN